MMADSRHEDAAASFDPLRRQPMRVAYRMLGSVADATIREIGAWAHRASAYCSVSQPRGQTMQARPIYPKQRT
jgi:hypothetical protein